MIKSRFILEKYPGKVGEEIQQLEEKEQELLEELEKQKDVIKKLKEDRTHYRKLADEYRYFLHHRGLCISRVFDRYQT